MIIHKLSNEKATEPSSFRSHSYSSASPHKARENCSVTVKMNVPGATHVGGFIGTGLYYYGEETAFKITNCAVNGEITGAVTPGAVAVRVENSVIESCEASVTLDGEALTEEIGKTETVYESADQGEVSTARTYSCDS